MPEVTFARLTEAERRISEGTATLELEVTLSGASGSGITVPITALGDTATAGTDYTLTTTSVAFAADATGNALTQTVTLAITDDDVYEGDETFTVAFGDLSSAGVRAGMVSRRRVEVTIADNDTLEAGFLAGTATVNEDAGTVELMFRLSATTAVDLVFPVMIAAGGSAERNRDYRLDATGITLVAGATGGDLTQTLSLPVLDDSIDEVDEMFTVSLDTAALPPRVTVPAATAFTGFAGVTVTVTDDDVPVVSVSALPGSVNEGETSTITVSSDRELATTLTIPFTIAGAGITDADYRLTDASGELVTSTLTLAAGSRAALLTLTTVIDEADTDPETLTWTLDTPAPDAGYTVGVPGAASLEITSSVAVATAVEFAPPYAVTVAEADDEVSVTVRLNTVLSSAITIPIMTTNGTAMAGEDYTAVTSVTLVPDAIMQTFSIPILNDILVETDETFTVSFGDLTTVGLVAGARRSVTVTITSEDMPIFQISTDQPMAVIDILEDQSATFTIRSTNGVALTDVRATYNLSAPSDRMGFTVADSGGGFGDVALVDSNGNAFRGDDNEEFVLLPAGQTSSTFRLRALNDGDSATQIARFRFNLVSTSAATFVANSNEWILIIRQDVMMSVAADPTTITAGGAASTITITAATAPVARPLPVSFTLGGTAEPADYTLVDADGMAVSSPVALPVGATSMELTLTGAIDADTEAEELIFTLIGGAGYRRDSANGTATVTIDPLPLRVEFEFGEYATDEPSPMLEIRVVLTGTPATAVTIPIRTMDDTTTAGEDYTALTTESVTFPAMASGGSLRQSLEISITNDASMEGTEQFLLSFGTLPDGVVALGNVVSTVRILDEDGIAFGFNAGEVMRVRGPGGPFRQTATMTVAEDHGTLNLVVGLDGRTPPVDPMDPVVFATLGINVSLMYTVEAGGTATAGEDYMLAAGTLTFVAGATGDDLMQTVSIPIINDGNDEDDEVFTVALTLLTIGTNGFLGRNTATAMLGEAVVVTITDDDVPVVSVAADPVAIAEGGTSTITIAANTAPVADLMIPFTLGGAAAPADYTLVDATGTAVASPITLPMGVSSAALTLTAVNDADTTAEALTVTLTAAVADAGYTVSATNTATVTIRPQPIVTVAADPTAVAEGGTSTITITADVAPTVDLTIPFTISGADNDDYMLAVGGTPLPTRQVTLPRNAASVDVVLTAVDDADTTAETLTLMLTAAANDAGYTVGATNTAMVTINPALAASFSVDAMTVAEDAGMVNVTVALEADAVAEITFPVMTMDGTGPAAATAGADYTALTSQDVTFAVGDRTQMVSVAITNDSVYENDETFIVLFGSLAGTGAVVGATSQVMVTITDNDALEATIISISSITVSEGVGTVNIPVQLSSTPAVAVTLTYMVSSPGDIARDGDDYTFDGSVTFDAGERMNNLSVSIIDDRLDEEFEVILVRFNSDQPARVNADPARFLQITITDNDTPVVSVVAAPTAVNEGSGSTITITSDIAPRVDRSVSFTITGSNIEDTDYTLTDAGTAVTTAATLLAGETSVVLTLETAADEDTVEETLTFTLTAGTGYTVSTTEGATMVTINPVVLPIVSFTQSAVSIAEDGGTVDLMVTLDRSPGIAVTIPVMTTDGTAEAGSDYEALTQNLMFASDATGAALTQTVSITVTDDNVYENDETFMVSFGTVPPEIASGSAVTVTITDEDTVSVGFYREVFGTRVAEDAGLVNVEMRMRGARAIPITIPVLIIGQGGAVRDMDFTVPVLEANPGNARGTQVVFPAGQTTAFLPLTIIDDSIDEPNSEGINLFLGNGQLPLPDRVTSINDNPARLYNQETISITDNDEPPMVEFTAGTATVAEGGGTVDVMVQLTVALVDEVVIPIRTMDGTTEAGDYTGLTTTAVTFAGGETDAQTVSISIAEDAVYENDETFIVMFGDLSGTGLVAGAVSQVTVTITDNDTLEVTFTPTPGFDAVTVSEDVGTVDISVQLSSTPAVDVAVSFLFFNPVPGNLATRDLDYTPVDSITFNAGERMKDLSVPIIDDELDEPTEMFFVRLVDPEAPRVSRRNESIRVEITDNDVPVVSVAAAPAAISGGAASTITITPNSAPATNLMIPFTLGGTAVPDDYTLVDAAGTAVSSPVTLPMGTASMALTLTAVSDMDTTPETLIFTLTPAVPDAGYTVGAPSTTTVTINPLPTVEFTTTSASAAEETTGVTLTVQLSAASATSSIVVPITATDVTATAGDDYRLDTSSVTFVAGATGDNLMQTVTVSFINDRLYENSETLTVSFGDLSGIASPGAMNSVTVTIEDERNDRIALDLVPVGGSAQSVNEDAGTVTIAMVVPLFGRRRSEATGIGNDVPVPLTIGGRATPNVDFQLEPVVIPAGTASGTMFPVNVTIVDDMLVEDAETVIVDTPQPTPLPFVEYEQLARVTVTITDNDMLVLSVSASPASIEEGGVSTITITSPVSPAADLMIPFTLGGTAVPGDYTLVNAAGTAVSSSVTLPRGDTSVALTLTAEDDTDTTPEALTFMLSAPADDADYTVSATNTATVTITRRVVTVNFATDTLSVVEAPNAMVDVMVTLDRTPAVDVVIPVMTREKDTDTARASLISVLANIFRDYRPLTEMVRFAAGATGDDLTSTVQVMIDNTEVYEFDETFTVSFGDLPDGVLAGPTDDVTVTIIDEDLFTAQWMVTGRVTTVSEDVGTYDLTLAVVNPGTVDESVTFQISTGAPTEGGIASATNGTDYELVDHFVTLSASTPTAVVGIRILNDSRDEPSEGLSVMFTPQVRSDGAHLRVARFGLNPTQITITDDD